MTSTSTQAERTLRAASSVGTIIEWYDFFVFASAAALVFDRAFFPRVEPLVGVLLGLMTYAVGFVTRPVGGIVFGILGDRVGRKRALVWSLVLMGLATVAVGLVPTYATIGLAAPALLVLLRLLQGVAVGGEVGGALLLVTETLSRERRGLWSAWPMIGGAVGNLLSAGMLALLGATLGEARFVAWGWRVAFVASGLLIVVGVWVRRRVEESPLYRAYVARRAGRPRLSLGGTLAEHWRAMLTVLFVKAGENALFYVFTTFFVVYVTRVLHRPRALALGGTLVSSVVEVGAIFAAGALSDRVGRRPVTALGLAGAAVWAFVLFPVCARGSEAAVLGAAAVGGLVHGVIVGGMSAFFVELFPTAARYTGFSVGYQLATVGAGAVAPLIGVALLGRFGSTVPVSAYAAAMALPGLVALWRARETAGTDLARVA
ncbi:General substrate transporter (plasmid) [Gemmatirosa kalamazoonensis]|uniref:General substrate transporter n=1 Tax=Gemmatirosa kalamazoonensis TaxID=861299 RepID=W0RSE1_9BACT|nr:MFS transporter [Gemmatirosa kalamazoonensis]AHG93904.1 General substrate transporter [Gemmatirosa kalamazoonensis]